MWLLMHIMLGLGTPRLALLAALLTVVSSQPAGAQLSIPVTTTSDFAKALHNANVSEIILDPSGTGVILLPSLYSFTELGSSHTNHALDSSLIMCLLQCICQAAHVECQYTDASTPSASIVPTLPNFLHNCATLMSANQQHQCWHVQKESYILAARDNAMLSLTVFKPLLEL